MKHRGSRQVFAVGQSAGLAKPHLEHLGDARLGDRTGDLRVALKNVYIYILYYIYIHHFLIIFHHSPERNMTILRYNSHFQTRSLPEQDIIKEEHGYIYTYIDNGQRWENGGDITGINFCAMISGF